MDLYRNYSENGLFFQYIQTLKNQFNLKKIEKSHYEKQI